MEHLEVVIGDCRNGWDRMGSGFRCRSWVVPGDCIFVLEHEGRRHRVRHVGSHAVNRCRSDPERSEGNEHPAHQETNFRPHLAIIAIFHPDMVNGGITCNKGCSPGCFRAGRWVP